jgi:hypothetical protein
MKIELSLKMAVDPGCPAGGGYCARVTTVINRQKINTSEKRLPIKYKIESSLPAAMTGRLP